MKKWFVFIVIFGGLWSLGNLVYGAAALVNESPILDTGTPVTIAISSTTLTKVPSSQTSGRMGIYVHNPSTWSVAGFLGNCTSTALASTIRPIQFGLQTVNTGPSQIQLFSLREDICLWLISLNTTVSESNIHYQEIKK